MSVTPDRVLDSGRLLPTDAPPAGDPAAGPGAAPAAGPGVDPAAGPAPAGPRDWRKPVRVYVIWDRKTDPPLPLLEIWRSPGGYFWRWRPEHPRNPWVYRVAVGVYVGLGVVYALLRRNGCLPLGELVTAVVHGQLAAVCGG